MIHRKMILCNFITHAQSLQLITPQADPVQVQLWCLKN